MSQSKIVKRLATNPKAMIHFRATGVMPSLREPLETPLLRLLKKVPYNDRVHFKSVRIGPYLGYRSDLEFKNAEALFRWLGGYGQLGDWETLPCESMAIKSFNKVLKIEDLQKY